MTHQISQDLGIPGYENPAFLGQGGFGSVYTARQVAFDRIVAIKILSTPGLNPDLRRWFQRECQALGKLSGHPNIVTVYDSGFTDGGRAYIAMNYTTGGSLAARLKERGPMPWQEALEIGIKLAGALETAHRAGVLHRDMKPENVLLSAYDEPELADFGSAAIQEGTAMPSALITATLPHAAPEVLGDRPASRATDVYSLASTVFTLMAGRPAFAPKSNEDIRTVLARIVTDPVPDLRTRGIPDAVCRVLERAMEKQPTARHPRAIDFGTELQRAQEELGLPVTPMRLAAVKSPAGETTTGGEETGGEETAGEPDRPAPDQASGPPSTSPAPAAPPAWGEPVDTDVTLLRAGTVPPAAKPDGERRPRRRAHRAWPVAAAVAAGVLFLSGVAALALRTVGTGKSGDADLSITASDVPSGEVGRDLTYELTLTNRGPADAREVTIVDAVPSGVIFKAARSHPSCKATNPTITCRPDRLSKGASVKIPITIVFLQPGRVTNTVTVSGADADPRAADNTASTKTSVRGCTRPGRTTTTVCA